MRAMRRGAVMAVLAAAVLVGPAMVEAACCYFSAKDKDVAQPAQKAFITWDPQRRAETFTVQPRFEGNAEDFGMVIPTPTRPRLDEMPRDFFKELAVFTILEPMDIEKFKPFPLAAAAADFGTGTGAVRGAVVVLEAGIVGSLDYKIILAQDATDLYAWLDENGYAYAGDRETLDFYIQKGWVFTVMKIDPKQMRQREDGTYEGEITPTRFSFRSDELVYPLRITRISVSDSTEALFYIQAPQKMDLPGHNSHAYTFVPMWRQAMSMAIPEKLTEQEKAWLEHTEGLDQRYTERVAEMRREGIEPATLEWAKRITGHDIAVLSGEAEFNREAPAEDVEKLKLLKGHVREGQFVTKMRKVFTPAEMTDDLTFTIATVEGREDPIEYTSILPTSPP